MLAATADHSPRYVEHTFAGRRQAQPSGRPVERPDSVPKPAIPVSAKIRRSGLQKSINFNPAASS